ncbi:hypothetical protein BDV59DRAFT_184879 [Aspergillus ambiguus]|uniref:uncharacterized protein n=1 Tax=Aspergillus ambiguus TaxID=176160 RepID=UPI003CCDA032
MIPLPFVRFHFFIFLVDFLDCHPVVHRNFTLSVRNHIPVGRVLWFLIRGISLTRLMYGVFGYTVLGVGVDPQHNSAGLGRFPIVRSTAKFIVTISSRKVA